MSQANLKIVENTLAVLAEKEKEKGKRKDNSADNGGEVEVDKNKEKGMKSGDRLKGNKMKWNGERKRGREGMSVS